MPARSLVPASQALFALVCAAVLSVSPSLATELRNTPIVKAVAKARPSVVNIHSEKTLKGSDARFGQIETSRRVNGMGTGIIVDERGFIVTNQHVIDGVEKIQVTLADGTTLTGKLVASDKQTDLAVIRVPLKEPLPAITIGKSDDLMTGEPVIAVGNAYGYEHTVTRGIISALHRMVQLNDSQKYENLIQTDASINPGNSGGPLLNIDGEMIGINVAVRAGAQGIGFAIPVNEALTVVADLLSRRRVKEVWLGFATGPALKKGLVIEDVEADSPAAKSGMQAGDLLVSIGDIKIAHRLDLERSLLEGKPGDELELTVLRDDEPQQLKIALAASNGRPVNPQQGAWELLGLKLDPVSSSQFSQFKTRYRGGMWVTDVRQGGPAYDQGIRAGDILVGLHIWETISQENITHILSRPDFSKLQPLKFYVLRNGKTLYGFMPLEQ